MALPGITDEQELKLLLKKLLENPDEVFKFAIVARGPKEGELILNKKEKLKKKEVQAEADAEAKRNNGGKPVKVDVITGECRLHKPGEMTLRLIVYGKAIAKAVACAEHLLVRGPYKTLGYSGVILEEIEEPLDTPGVPAPSTVETPPTTSTIPPPPPQPTSKPAPTVDPSVQFTKRLTDLMPAIKAAAGTPAGDEAKLRASEAGVFARKQDFVQANKLLDQVEAALKSTASTASTAPPPSPPNPATLFTQRLTALMPAIKAAAGTPAGDEAKLRASEAGVFARKQDFVQANQLLDQVEAALKSAAPESSVPEQSASAPTEDDPVAKTGKPANAPTQPVAPIWEAVSEDVMDQTTAIIVALRKLGDSELDRMADDLLETVENYLTELSDLLQEYDGLTGDERTTMAARALEFVEQQQRDIEKDELIVAADTNPLDVKISLAKTMDAALQQIVAAFQA